MRCIKADILIPASKVAVVILNWNGKSFLEKFLPSVIASVYEGVTVIVADNASTDDSVSFVKQSHPSVRIIHNPENEGFAKGYNTALKQVEADYYVLLNSDVSVTPGWIEPIIVLMERDRMIAACQPKIRAYDHPAQFEYAGAAGGWMDILGYPFSRGRVFDFCETDTGQYDQVQEIFWATGTALFVRSDVFREMKGFDETFFAHQEEIDLCWRMRSAGYKVYVHPSSVVYHVGGGTLPMGNQRKVFLNFRNNLIMLAKNLPLTEKIWKMPLRFVLDAAAALQALLKADVATCSAILKAYFSFIKRSGGIEKSCPHPPHLKELPGVYRGSIVWQYFIRKRKTFSEIMGAKK